MTLLRLSALSAALVMASSVQANFLTDEGSLDLHLRNYFMDNSKELSGNKLKAHQWAQAFSVNYSSGYFHNIIGFDLGGHYALKLKADSDLNASSPGLLPVDSNGKSSSYGKNSYAIKVNLMDMGVAKYGRIFLDTPLMNENYSRSLPSLTEGFYADGNFAGANLYGIWAIKTNHRTESGFDYLMTENGKKNPVKVLGGGYDFDNGLEAHLAVGQQSDYATRYYGDVSYSTDLQGATVSGGFKYGNNKRIGFSKKAGEDNSQNTWGVSVKADIQQASVGISYQKVSQSDIGGYNTEWAGQEMTSGDMTGYFGPHDLMVSSFSDNGEKSWGVNAGYDFAGLVDGLSVSAIYVKGTTDPKTGNDKDESEYNLVAVYALPQVENLSLSALYGKNTKKDKGTGNNKETNSQLRLIAKYDMSVF